MTPLKSIKSDPPELGVDVLLAIKMGNGVTVFHEGFRRAGYQWYVYKFGECVQNVVGWAPLPKPGQPPVSYRKPCETCDQYAECYKDPKGCYEWRVWFRNYWRGLREKYLEKE